MEAELRESLKHLCNTLGNIFRSFATSELEGYDDDWFTVDPDELLNMFWETLERQDFRQIKNNPDFQRALHQVLLEEKIFSFLHSYLSDLPERLFIEPKISGSKIRPTFAEAIVFRNDIFEDLFQSLIDSLHGKHRITRFVNGLAPSGGDTQEFQEIQLGDDVTVQRKGDSFRLVIRLPLREHLAKATEKPDVKIDRIQTTMRLFWGLGASLDTTRRSYVDGAGPRVRSVPVRMGEWSDFAAFWQSVKQDDKAWEAAKVALFRYQNITVGSGTFSGERLIDLVIALESLLPERDGEMQYKLAFRTAMLANLLFGIQDRQPYDDVHRALKTRNTIVHGSAIPDEDKVKVDATLLSNLESLIRRILVVFLCSGITENELRALKDELDTLILDRMSFPKKELPATPARLHVLAKLMDAKGQWDFLTHRFPFSR